MPGTSPATRERVLTAALELNYIASDRGRALSTSSTRRVAVVSAELTNPYYPELVEPLRQELDHRDYRTVVVTDNDRSEVGIDALAGGSYDGVVLTTTSRRSTLPRDLSERGIPHVLVNRVLDHPESPSVGIDNRAGGAAVADLLKDLGHSRIGLVAGPVDTSTGRERADGLRARLRVHRLHIRRELTRRCSFTHDAGREATAELLRLPDPPTAVVCGNDVIAFGALSAAHEHGFGVPTDLTVIGFDDIAMAGWPAISLTTMHSDLGALARTSVELLIGLLEGADDIVVERLLAPRLILRSTHAVPRSHTTG